MALLVDRSEPGRDGFGREPNTSIVFVAFSSFHYQIQGPLIGDEYQTNKKPCHK